MGVFFCEHCKKDTKFLPIRNTIQVAEVSRSTLYYWMERTWIHWRELPSGRRIICQESLSDQARQLSPGAYRTKKNLSETVRERPVVHSSVG